MEISEQSLRGLVADADEQHRAGMNSLPNEIRALHSEVRRRRFRRLGAAGTGVAIGGRMLSFGAMAPRAAALADDAGIAAFAESVELTAVQAYMAAASSGLVTTKGVLDAATAFAGHHTEHAAAFGAAAGTMATGKANQKLLDALTPGLTAAKTEDDVVKLAYDLENAAAATYLYALGALTSTAALQLTASILPVEAQHAVVLGQVLGLDLSDIVPAFQSEDGYVDPATYPL